MFTNLIRRLQGRPVRHAPSPDCAVPVADAPAPAVAQHDGEVLDARRLEERMLAWAFDLPEAPSRRDPDAAEAAFTQLQAIAQRFDVRRMPRLPALVPQLLAAMRREDSDAAQIAGLLERDPTLAGDVMRLANSAFYRRAQAPAGLQQAVQVLGTDGLRHVVLGSVMRPILRGDAGHPGFASAGRLWSLSEARAWLCGRLAARRDEAGESHLAGVVAGTGIAALSRMVPASLLADAASDPAFAERFLDIARPVSARAGLHWQLPARVVEALEAVATPGSTPPPLARTLVGADRLAMGYRLVEAGRLQADALWPTGLPDVEAPAQREPLFAAMARELEPLDAAPAAA